MIATAFIQHLPKLSLHERCLLHELAGYDCGTLNASRVADLIGRRYREDWNAGEIYDQAAAEVEWLDKNGGGIIPFSSREYPELLREIYDPPLPSVIAAGGLIQMRRMQPWWGPADPTGGVPAAPMNWPGSSPDSMFRLYQDLPGV